MIGSSFAHVRPSAIAAKMLLAVVAFAAVGIAAPAQAAPLPVALSQTPSAAERAVFDRCLADAKADTSIVCVARVADACIAKDGGETTAGMIACDARERALWTARIDTQQAALRAQHNPAQAAALEAAQTAFARWRDAKCAYAATIYEGGSLARVVESRCRLEVTAAWSADLSRRLDDPDAK